MFVHLLHGQLSVFVALEKLFNLLLLVIRTIFSQKVRLIDIVTLIWAINELW